MGSWFPVHVRQPMIAWKYVKTTGYNVLYGFSGFPRPVLYPCVVKLKCYKETCHGANRPVKIINCWSLHILYNIMIYFIPYASSNSCVLRVPRPPYILLHYYVKYVGFFLLTQILSLTRIYFFESFFFFFFTRKAIKLFFFIRRRFKFHYLRC